MQLRFISLFLILFFLFGFNTISFSQIKRKKNSSYNSSKQKAKLKHLSKSDKKHQKDIEAYQKKLESKKEEKLKEEERLEKRLKEEKKKEEELLAHEEKKKRKEIEYLEKLKKAGKLPDTTQHEEVKNDLEKPKSYWNNPDNKFYFDIEGLRTLDSTNAMYYIIRTDKTPSKRHKRLQRTLEFIEDTDGAITGYYMTGEKYFDGYSDMGNLDYKYTSYYKNGQKKEEGYYESGLLHLDSYWDEEEEFIVEEGSGRLTEYYLDGSKKGEGRYKRGFKVGKWSYFYPGEVQKSVIEHVDGRERILDFWSRDGKQLVSEGRGKYINTYSNGFEREYCKVKAGFFHGLYKSYYVDSTLKEHIPYEYGLKNGVSFIHYSNGSIKTRGRYEYDLPVGIWKDWFIDHKFHLSDFIKNKFKRKTNDTKAKAKQSKFKSQYYKTIHLREVRQYLEFGDFKVLEAYDRRGRSMLIKGDGYYTDYYGNGEQKQEFYIVDGHKNGKYTLWYPDGSLHETGYFIDDVKKPTSHKKRNGIPLLIGGKGPCVYNYYNGQPKYRINYNNYLPSGKYESFYTNGSIRTRGEYKEGEKSGVWSYYDRIGNTLKVEKFYVKDDNDI